MDMGPKVKNKSVEINENPSQSLNNLIRTSSQAQKETSWIK